MPSVSPKQARTMAGAAHDPAFAKKMSIPQSVAKEFNQADKGGPMLSKGNKPKTASYAEGGPVLGRTREFLKEPVPFRSSGSGEQEYEKGKKKSEVKDKSLKPVKPRS